MKKGTVSMKILLLEDDPILSDILLCHLDKHMHQTTHFSDGQLASDALNDQKFDLLILDINVPKLSGIDLLKEIRTYQNNTPAIVITAFQDTAHLKKSFENGCDDYIKKPFDLEELDLRIKNIQKRFHIVNEEAIKLDDNILLIVSKNRLFVDEISYTLTRKECKILLYLCNQKGKVISSEELIQNLWDYHEMPSEATIRVYIKNLRNILGKEKIQTVRGNGYIFE